VGEARVVRVQSDKLISAQVVNARMLRSALEQGVRALARKERIDDAWHAFLRPDDVILLKFNQSARDLLGTTPVFADQLMNSLVSAGWGPDRLVVLEASGNAALLRRTRPPDFRWPQAEVDFGSCGRDAFLATLEQVTAIINVPFLKTHHLATMSGCLKNLSHGLIRHPARFHAGGCDPAIARIVASDPLRSRLRLSIVNALRIIHDRGADAGPEDTHPAGVLLLSQDPVAGDAVGYATLNAVRSLRGRDPLLPDARLPRQLLTAAGLGLGTADIDAVRVESLEG
jgi:hypothetical protein